jgi:hypothetical protein
MNIFALALIAIAFAQQPAKSPESPRVTESHRPIVSQQGQTTKHDHSESNDSSPPPDSVSIRNQACPPDREINALQANDDARIQGRLVLYTGLLVLAGFVTAAVVGWQALESRKAAQAARDSVRLTRESIVLTHRPKIIVRSVVIPWMAILNRHTPMNAGQDLDDSQLGGFFYAVNVGNQPAILESLDEFMSFDSSLPMERPYESGQNRRALGYTIQPGASYKIRFTPKQTHSLELAVVAVNEGPFVVGGRIIYADTLGNRRETAFCRKVDHQLARLIVVDAPDYEYAD